MAKRIPTEANSCWAARPNRADGARCTFPKGYRTNHPGFGRCYVHGGSSPPGRKSGLRQMAEHAVNTLGLPRNVDPHTALLEEVHRTAGHVAWLAQRVAELEADAVVQGQVTETREHDETDEGDVETLTAVPGAEKPPDGKRSAGRPPGPVKVKVSTSIGVNVWIDMYQRERKHLVDVCRTAIACGIAERQVRIAEEQGRMMIEVIAGILTELGVDPRSEAARLATRKHLLLASGTVG